MYLEAGIIDLDGTIALLEVDHIVSEVARISSILKIAKPDERRVREFIASGSLQGLVSSDIFPNFEELFWENYNESTVLPLRLHPLTRSSLANFRENGIELALVTARNITEHDAAHALKIAGIDQFFRLILTKKYCSGHWQGKDKLFLEAMRFLGVPPSRTFAVGDRPSDAESGEKVGLALNVLVRSGGTKESLLANSPCHHVMDDIGELARFIDDLKSPFSNVRE